jgi:putative Mg2+ transporter-C (MgtC) family protein
VDATALEWWEVMLRISGAALLGGTIGIEREVDGQDAGFRTHLLLAVGAALFGAISVGAFDDFVVERARTNVNVDVTRIASYVAAGIGFLGGGAIVKSGGSVKGMTTASSLWTAAAVGLAAGVGFWVGAFATTVAALFALSLLKPVSNLFRRRFVGKDTVVITLDGGGDVAAVVDDVRTSAGKLVKQIMIGQRDGGDGSQVQIQFWDQLDTELVRSLFDRVGQREDVTALRVGA